VKTNEENYLLYQRKREQARMTEALDRTRIVNVAVAEQPVVPSLPSNSRAVIMLLGTLAGAVVTVGAVFTQDYLDPSFRTPAEVAQELKHPRIALGATALRGLPGHRNRWKLFTVDVLTSTLGERSGN